MAICSSIIWSFLKLKLIPLGYYFLEIFWGSERWSDWLAAKTSWVNFRVLSWLFQYYTFWVTLRHLTYFLLLSTQIAFELLPKLDVAWRLYRANNNFLWLIEMLFLFFNYPLKCKGNVMQSVSWYSAVVIDHEISDLTVSPAPYNQSCAGHLRRCGGEIPKKLGKTSLPVFCRQIHLLKVDLKRKVVRLKGLLWRVHIPQLSEGMGANPGLLKRKGGL